MAIILDEHGTTPQSGGPAGDLIKDTTMETFVADVVEASATVPVIVDFWAPWCGPCKTLGPMLEKLVRQAGGTVRMVKINVDENQQLAAQFQVQSIPAVYAFSGGRPVDAFQGALPESQLKLFIENLTGAANAVDEALAEAKTLREAGDAMAAQQIYLQILQQDPGNANCIGGLLRCYMDLGNTDQAREIVEQLPPEFLKQADVIAVKAALELIGAGAGEAAELEARLSAAPGDHQVRYDLALAYYAVGRNEDAVDALLDILRADQTWNEGQAKAQLLKLFEAFGFSDPVSIAGRRKLSTLLFS